MPTHDALTSTLLHRFRGAGLDAELVAEFVGVSVKTVKEWLEDKRPPRGERLHRLWLLLAEATGETLGLERVPEFGRYLGELLAYGLVNLSEARDYCGVRDAQAVLQFVRGTRQPMVSHLQFTLAELQQKYDKRLKVAKQELKEKLEASREIRTVSTSREGATPRLRQQSAIAAGHDSAFLMNAARAIIDILPLTGFLLDECSPAERARLRELVTPEAMFELSNRLNQLCSERARTTGG